MDNSAKERQRERFDPATKKYTKENYSVDDGDSFVSYSRCDLLFIKAYTLPEDEENNELLNKINQAYADYGQIADNEYFAERGFPFIELLTHNNDSILFMSMLAICDTLEMLTWIVYHPYEYVKDRFHINYVENARCLYGLLKVRIMIIVSTQDDEDLLDGPPEFIDHVGLNKVVTANMTFIKHVSAYMDQLELDMFTMEVPPEDTIFLEIPENDKKRVYNYYLRDLQFDAVMEMFIDFRADQIVTRADKYTNELKFGNPTTKMDDLLALKNDEVYNRMDKVKMLDDALWNMQLFEDFIFWYAYEQRFNKPIKYERDLFFNIYKYDGVTWYGSLAALIYSNFIHELCKESTTSFYSLYNNDEEEEIDLPYVYL
jgi:hypothetical protein